MQAAGDHYRTLGIDPGADPVAIRLAYRALMRRYHPDVNRSAEAAERATAINEAYACLGDDERRAAYDRERSPPPPRPMRRTGMGPGAARPRTAHSHFHQRPDSEFVFEPEPQPTHRKVIALALAVAVTIVAFFFTSAIKPLGQPQAAEVVPVSVALPEAD